MPLFHARPVILIVCRNRAAGERFYGDTLGLRRAGGDDHAAIFDVAESRCA